MSCEDCQGCIACGSPNEAEVMKIAELAYGPMPEDGRLLDAKAIRFFAGKVLEELLAPWR